MEKDNKAIEKINSRFAENIFFKEICSGRQMHNLRQLLL